MIPGHGKEFKLKKEPESLKAKIDVKSEGDSLKITLSSTEKFKGFLIVVQDKDESNKGVPIGEFVIEGNGIRGVKCKDDMDNGVSHSNPELKSKVTVNWKNDNFNSVIIR